MEMDKQLDCQRCRVDRRRLAIVAWVGKPAPPASNNHLRRIGPMEFGDDESRRMWTLEGVFSLVALRVSRDGLSQCAKRRGICQCHDDDDERGARDSDLFAGARGLVRPGQGPCVVVAHKPPCFGHQSHVCCFLLFAMTRIRSYGPANLVSCRFASWARDWAGRVRDGPLLHPSLPPFALALSPSSCILTGPLPSAA